MTTSIFKHPGWSPRVPEGMRILITGASGGIGQALVAMLLDGPDCIIGAHGATRATECKDHRVISITKTFKNESDCARLIDAFCKKAGGIDALIVLSGAIHFSGHWKDMPASDWERDVQVNLNQPLIYVR